MRSERMLTALTLLLGAASVIAIACSSDTNQRESTGCTPGETQNCLGPDSCYGTQTCQADGAWGQCDCDVQDGTGGSADSGGTGGAQTGGSGGVGPSGGTGGIDGTGGTPPSGGSGGIDIGGCPPQVVARARRA